MRLSSSSVSSSKWRKNNWSGSRLRKKHKRLDAICEREYNQNHGDSNGGNGGVGMGGGEEVRRSSRVRKAPVFLDVSPSPPKKRRKTGRNVIEGNAKMGCSPLVSENGDENSGEFDMPGSWKSRLRSRGQNVGSRRNENRGSPQGKRKLFKEIGEEKAVMKLDGKEGESEGVKPTVVRSKRSGRIKASSSFVDGEKESDSLGTKYENEKNEVEAMGDDGEGMQLLESEVGGVDEKDTEEGNDKQILKEGETETPNSLRSEEGYIDDINVETTEQIDAELEQSEHVKEGEDQRDVAEAVAIPTNQVEDKRGLDERDASLIKLDEKPSEEEKDAKGDQSNGPLPDTLGKPRIKVGRHCGLCGGGTDGKPPKKIVHDMGDSENETYSGTSASEDPNYDIWDGFGDESGWLGRLLGPINDRYGIAGTWVHQHCAVWSPEVYFAGLGCLKNVRAALCRGRALKCSRCGRPGATIGCRVDRCPKTYHLPCARANGCIFDHRKFLIACTDHRNLFQPQGTQYLNRIKKMKAKKMKLDMRKLSNDACRKDIEAEEKWLENCGEDEEFLKRESKRLHRDLLRIAPVYIGGADYENGKFFQGWESVAGLQDVIRCMKEVVILPLLYPEFFNNLGLTPPRGVLLHGYPGTGKTLVVRALIGSCARGDKRIAYFARKGADCLGKYVGDAERQLRLLFQVAERCQPSIIFFDEIDGLAPCRTRQQDQTHSSVVSTLLALLDGLKSRGSVVVIGATNRPEAVDPALRRPGRFDREIYFPLPSVEDRASILSLHTQRWPKPVIGSLLKWVAQKTAGYAGADLQALCTQAAMIALKRNFPLQETLSAAEERAHNGDRLPLPAFAVEERDWLEALLCASPPCSRREAGMAANDVVCSSLPTHLIPCLLQPLSILLVSLSLGEHLWLPPPLYKAGTMIKSVMISALDRKKMPRDCWWFHVIDFLREADVAEEIIKKLSYAGIVVGGSIFADSDGFDDGEKFLPSIVHQGSSRLNSISSGKRSGYRILISGSPKLGQRHLASCLLHCYVGHVEIQKVDLATISQEGRGDVLLGLTQILKKCATAGSCIVFMPRVDLWAVESHQVTEENNTSSINHECSEKKNRCSTTGEVVEKENEPCPLKCKESEIEEPKCSGQSVSHAWSSFVEQVESMGVSSSLMILATSEVPYPLLPSRIRQFFKSSELKCSRLAPLEHTIPRFSVQLDGSFNNDMVISLSAAKLSRDIIQKSIQLFHQKLHSRNSHKEYKTCISHKTSTDNICRDTYHGSPCEHLGKTQLPDESFKKSPFPPNIKTVKGKSSLMLAISTFGYQIMRYPHFAELCWATSKLKEGPSADTNGAWKGWPFNSCIVRPDNSLEKVAVACSSSSVKSKEKSGFVRGLMAVGLLAYRGAYTSLREVSSDIRKVLELLVGQINAKIQAGKDRHQYIRLLSQVAYLEDMVNTWAYALQSSEFEVQMTEESPKVSTVECPDNHEICLDNSVQGEEFQPNVANGSSHELKVLEEHPNKFSTENMECVDLNQRDENMECVDLNKRDGDLGYPDTDGILKSSEDGSAQQIDPSGCLIPVNDVQRSIGADQLDGKTLNDQNGTMFRTAELVNTTNNGILDGDNGTLRHSNGSLFTESIVLSEDGHCSSGELCGVKLCELAETEINSDDGKPEADGQIEDSYLSHNTDCYSTNSSAVCLYQCCSECLYTLHDVLHKFLIQEWGLNKNHWRVEAVHDIVASLSVALLSTISKGYVAESHSSSVDDSITQEIHEKVSEHLKLRFCGCKNSGYGLVVPVECTCHSISKCGTRANTSLKTRIVFDSKFIFRDGVLVPLDPDEDVSFHCKYESLCLCSLIELIAMTKQVFD